MAFENTRSSSPIADFLARKAKAQQEKALADNPPTSDDPNHPFAATKEQFDEAFNRAKKQVGHLTKEYNSPIEY